MLYLRLLGFFFAPSDRAPGKHAKKKNEASKLRFAVP